MKKLLVMLLCVLCSYPALAKTEFFATIPVDVEAQDSVQAKDKAMLEAERQAFLEVAGKLTSEENVQKLSELSDDELSYFVQSVSVDNEKAGGTKYKADLTVQLNEPLLRDYLTENDMIKSEISEMVVVPIYKPLQSYALLWEENNEWRQQWLSKGLIKFGSQQLRAINDRYRQIDGLNGQAAQYMDGAIYEKISQIGGTERVYVVYAAEAPNGDLNIIVRDEKNKAEESFTVYNDGSGALMDKAIEKSVMFISNMERNAKNMSDVAVADSINAVYMYQNMKDWLDKSAVITGLPMVEGLETNSFGGGKVSFVLRYNGALDDLWQALQEQGISHEAVENHYVLR